MEKRNLEKKVKIRMELSGKYARKLFVFQVIFFFFGKLIETKKIMSNEE